MTTDKCYQNMFLSPGTPTQEVCSSPWENILKSTICNFEARKTLQVLKVSYTQQYFSYMVTANFADWRRNTQPFVFIYLYIWFGFYPILKNISTIRDKHYGRMEPGRTCGQTFPCRARKETSMGWTSTHSDYIHVGERWPFGSHSQIYTYTIWESRIFLISCEVALVFSWTLRQWIAVEHL